VFCFSIVEFLGDSCDVYRVSNFEVLDLFYVFSPEGELLFLVLRIFDGDGGDESEFSVVFEESAGGFSFGECTDDTGVRCW